MKKSNVLLGVNVDHIATVRNARGTDYPSPYDAALLAKLGGADGITIHLREDRRHIIDEDVRQFCNNPILPINLEIAATQEMQEIALKRKPTEVCIVPEKREELTTEGGLNVVAREDYLKKYIQPLKEAGIKVSLFVDPELNQLAASARVGADIIELHTGTYAEYWADKHEDFQCELQKLQKASTHATGLGLVVNAGHGLTIDNVAPIAQIDEIYCLNIGHSIIARSLFVGIESAVGEMVIAISSGRIKNERKDT